MDLTKTVADTHSNRSLWLSVGLSKAVHGLENPINMSSSNQIANGPGTPPPTTSVLSSIRVLDGMDVRYTLTASVLGSPRKTLF